MPEKAETIRISRVGGPMDGDSVEVSRGIGGMVVVGRCANHWYVINESNCTAAYDGVRDTEQDGLCNE